MDVIRENARSKEEIFKSDYVTLGEMAVHFKTYEEMYRQQNEYRDKIMPPKKIEDRWEILDL